MSEHAIGIDLGTTYSALAVVNPAGKPEIVANRDGERTTSSAIYVQPDGRVLVGQMAADAAQGEPDRVARWAKRAIGTSTDWSFEVDGRAFSPIDVSALVLRKVRGDAEVVLGPIRRAVVTVPAYFDEPRRKATMDAAKQAGIEVLRIINEPTAASLAYAADGRVQGKLLIYDFGGGTFDVSVVQVDAPTDIRVLASEGDHRLGGFDLDQALATHFSQLFEDEHGVALMDNEDPAARHRALAEAERAKRKLSTMTRVGPIPLNRGSYWMNATIERAKFEELIEEYIVRTEMLVEEALRQASVAHSDIDDVILVGGSTRIPAVKASLERAFGKPPLCSINPDEAVALGAALQAGLILSEQGSLNVQGEASRHFQETRLQDVTNHSYGTLSMAEVYGRQQLRNTIMIRKNTPLPCSRTESFGTMTDGQEEVDCSITQGEDVDPEFVNTIAKASLLLPPGRPKGCEIRVTYSYDANQRMSCEFLDVDSGRRKRINLDILQGGDAAPSAPLRADDVDLDDLEIL